MTKFYDSTVIADIPADAQYLAAYHDGNYAVTAGQIRRTLPDVTNVRWITIESDFHSGIVDFEPRNPVFDDPAMLRRWALGRHSLQMSTPIVYCDRDNAALAVARLDGLRALYWIATLDDQEPGWVPWTPETLSANLAGGDNGTVPPVLIPPARIWANQYHTQREPTFDESELFLGWWA